MQDTLGGAPMPSNCATWHTGPMASDAPRADSSTMAPFWFATDIPEAQDSHVAFRGLFTTVSGTVEIRMVGSAPYLVYMDGNLVGEGPARFPSAFPETQSFKVEFAPGRHMLAVHAHYDGVRTPVLPVLPPFLCCEVYASGSVVPVNWKCAAMPGYAPKTRRISDIFGWVDWLDTRQSWSGWKFVEFNDSDWQEPVPVHPGIGPIARARTHPVRLEPVTPKLIEKGKLAEVFGYERDDPSVRFFLRDLEPKDVPPSGVWRRYDLGRTRMGRPRFTLDVTEGSVVEIAVSEQLRHGRVHPFIPLTGGPTCAMDHFVARGGVQEFMPFTPKGGRFMEVHVLSAGPVEFLKEGYLDRAYFGEPEGSFECDDPLLNRIWLVGVNTLRSCAEDAMVDCPTRERAQWTGDVCSVATEICACAYPDLSLPRRALVQAAQAAREDGMVAGVGPGMPTYLSTYAAQWVSACVHFWELSGDKSLLEELLPAAERNLGAFDAKWTHEGLPKDLGWAFVDWGDVKDDGPSDLALNIHYLMAQRATIRWYVALGVPDRESAIAKKASVTEATVRAGLQARLANEGWPAVGYRRAALALLAGLVDPGDEHECVSFIKESLLRCFPNDPSAPRLAHPEVCDERTMTPYFGHFLFSALLDRGEVDFVLDQFRTCWGWALGDDRTTWLEVFDTRWSHCHEWSGCPTWQLTWYVLGLRPRFDLGADVYEFRPHPGSLTRAAGSVPMPGGDTISISWTRDGKELKYEVNAPRPITVRTANRELRGRLLQETIPARVQ